MKAWTYERYGSPEVLSLTDIEEPRPKRNEITIRVQAAGFNAADWHIMRADPALTRPVVGLRRPRRPMIVGSDVAGIVEEVGDAVTRFSPGDRVYAEVMLIGACAELTKVRADRAARMPASLDFLQAAAVPMAATTALVGVRDDGRLQPGQSVLVVGASGGVGTFAVQIARTLGGHVTAVCGARAVELVRSLGADEVFDYAETDVIDSGRKFDLVVNVGGNATLRALRRTLTARGTLAAVGSSQRGGLLGPGSVGIRGKLLSPFVRQRLISVMGSSSGRHLEEIATMIDAGDIAPVIDRAWGFDEVPQAMRHLEDGHPIGKVVVSV